jgi:uncharacterized HAD superfamily protein
MFAVDIDGVLANTEPWIVRALEDRLGRPLPRDVNVYEAMGIRALIPEEERPAFERAWQEVLTDSEVYARATPYPGALEALLWLHRHRLLRGYVTTRPPALMKATEAWLTEWGFPPAPLVQDGGDRAGAMRLMRAEVLVEDHPGKALEVAEVGHLVFLMDRPYNRTMRHKRIFRSHGWEGLLDLLKVLPLDTRARRDPLGWPEKKKEGRRG